MSIGDIAGLAYLVVGLVLAGIAYALFMGDYRAPCDDPACEVHGAFNREADELADSVHLLLDSPHRAKAALGIVLFLVILLSAWPGVVAFVVVRSRHLGRDR